MTIMWNSFNHLIQRLLAHLSRKLIGELIVYAGIRRPCVRLSINIFKRHRSNRKAMNRNWSNQKGNPALKTKTGNK